MVKSLSCVYKSAVELENFIEEHELYDYPNILIQVFSSMDDERVFEDIQGVITEYLPYSSLIGCTTHGEIIDGQTIEHQAIINFSIFEKTTVASKLFHVDSENTYEIGKNIYSTLCTMETQALIIFTTDYNINIEEILSAIYEENQNLKIAGGIAGPTSISNYEGIVLDNNSISKKGIVVVSLSNRDLQVETFTNYQMQEIGKSFLITKGKGNVIYSIDHKKPLQIFKQYLGDDFVENIQEMSIEFPFIIDAPKGKRPIHVTKILSNGAIEVNSTVDGSSRLTFAFIDLKGSMERSIKEFRRLAKSNVEALFLYNGFTRRKLMRKFVAEEATILHSLAPTNGFFSRGEISSEKNRMPNLLGHAFTYMAIGESTGGLEKKSGNFRIEPTDDLKTLVTLTHLMNASQKEIKQLDDSMKISEQYYRSLFDNNTDIVYSTDLQGNFMSVNSAFIKSFGYTKEEIIGKSALKFIHVDDIPRVKMHFLRAVKGKEQYYNIEIVSKSGEKLTIHFKNIPITVKGECVGIYGIGRDITEQKKIEDRMIQLAYFDQDTGLPNRIKFTEKLGELLARAKRKKRKLAVLVLDLDRFKIINDSFGHEAGDEVLREISERIQDALPSGSYLGRFSGDKFNIVLSKNVGPEETMKISNSILRNISEPIHYMNQEFYITASIGISFYPDDGDDEILLIKNADLAMNRSKYPGGNRVTLYSNGMNDEALHRLELESYLRKALKKEEFFLCYQPLIDLHTSQVYGSEALIRWNHPKYGLVSPGQFIPIAEETGLIEEIGSWVLRTACKQNKKWQDMGFKELTVSVNVSAQQFQQQKFVREVERALKESGLHPQYLTLELTESTMLRNLEHSIAVMKSLQELGVRVSIDDFGTGYSSLSYLKDLPINTLKIDRSFINNLRLDTSDIAIVKAIITMGHGLALKVVAEGVETKEQIELLRELNCHYAQGFYLHRPIPAYEFEDKVLSSIS